MRNFHAAGTLWGIMAALVIFSSLLLLLFIFSLPPSSLLMASLPPCSCFSLFLFFRAERLERQIVKDHDQDEVGEDGGTGMDIVDTINGYDRNHLVVQIR